MDAFAANRDRLLPRESNGPSLTALDDLARRLETVSPPALANLLGVGQRKVLEWIAAGELSALNMAGAGSRFPRYRIPIAEVEAFLARRRTDAAAAGRARRE